MDQTSARHPLRPAATVTTTVAVAACLALLLTVGGSPVTDFADPGPLVGWGQRLARVLGLVAAVLTVGGALVAAVLVRDRDTAAIRSSLGSVRSAATAWAAAGAVGYVLSVCETEGVTLTGLAPGRLLPWTTTAPTAAHLVSAGLAATVAGLAPAAQTPARRRVVLAVALAAALPVPLTGHVAGVEDGEVATAGLAVHVVAALLWTGGLTGLVLHLRRDRDVLGHALPRFSALALGAWVAVAGSGLLAASAALPVTGDWRAAWSSDYAAIVVAKASVLAVLGGVGLWHRRVTLPAVRRGRPGAFARLAAVEVVIMSAGLGLAAALSRTAVPVPPLAKGGHGGSGVEDLSWTTLVTTWRPNAVVLVVAGGALVAYLVARHRVVAAGRAWPTRRTLPFVLGVGLAVLVLCSGVAVYSSLLLSAHLGSLLVMLVVVPALLLAGRPLDLSRAVGRDLPAGLTRRLTTPTVGGVAACLLLLAVHWTPLIELSLRSPWWNLVVMTAALGCGSVLLGPTRDGASGRTSGGERSAWLVLVGTCLGLIALRLRADDRLLAADWFLELRLGWVEPADDQRVAGLVALAGALTLLLLAVASRITGRDRALCPDEPAPPARGTQPQGEPKRPGARSTSRGDGLGGPPPVQIAGPHEPVGGRNDHV